MKCCTSSYKDSTVSSSNKNDEADRQQEEAAEAIGLPTEFVGVVRVWCSVSNP